MKTTVRIILIVQILCLHMYSSAITNVKGNVFLLKTLRLFTEINPILDEWGKIDNTLAELEPNDLDFDWEKMNKQVAKLYEKAQEMFMHYAEDLKKIEIIIDESQLIKLKPFFDKALIYTDTTLLAVTKRAEIINRLYKMVLDPESWTAEEYLKEVEKYQAVVKKFEEEGTKLNEEFKKTEVIIIKLNNKVN